MYPKKQHTNACETVDRENAVLPDKLEKYLTNILVAKDKRNIEEAQQHTELFGKKHKHILIDVLDITVKIKELEDTITAFKTEVDYKLSESNAITQIEVELKD